MPHAHNMTEQPKPGSHSRQAGDLSTDMFAHDLNSYSSFLASRVPLISGSHNDLSARAVTRYDHNSLRPYFENSAHADTRQNSLLSPSSLWPYEKCALTLLPYMSKMTQSLSTSPLRSRINAAEKSVLHA